MGTNNFEPSVEETYPLSYHLDALKKVMLRSTYFILAVFIICYWRSESIYNFVISPVKPFLNENIKMTMIWITEGFLTEIKMCFLASLFFSMPFILYQLWLFIAPGLYKKEKKWLLGFVFCASILFLSGGAFAYYMVFPLGFKFFLSFANSSWGLQGSLSTAMYLSFIMKIILAFGMAFELPVIIFFLSKIGLINPGMLIKYRKYAIVGIFIVAAFITPPDVISQLALAFPLLILYEISIIVTKLATGRGRQNVV